LPLLPALDFAMPDSPVEFSIDKPRYNLSTYYGRLLHFFDVTSPLTLLKTDDEIRFAEAAINKFRDSGTLTGGPTQMWSYQSLVNAAIHPATGEIVPALFRMSAIAPMNIPICYFMLQIPPANVAATLGIHIFNQSYNSACNYFNRSGEGAPLASMGKSYVLAITSACGLAFGMGKVVQKVPALQRFSIWIPILASALASSSNLAFTRADEVMVGANVVDEHGNSYGKSLVAGRQGVMQTALSRCVMVPCAVFLLPDMIIKTLKKHGLSPRSPRMGTALYLGVLVGCLAGALPATLAVFPQTAEFDVTKLEPQFQHLTSKTTGAPVTKLFAQKGL
jgi:sideroflexin-5